jgi:hypothetical protein
MSEVAQGKGDAQMKPEHVTVRVSDAEHAAVAKRLAVYTATVHAAVERSDFALSSALTDDDKQALLTSPEWIPDGETWPAASLTVAYATSVDLSRAALTKMRYVVTFGAGIERGSGERIRAALYRRFPRARALFDEAQAKEGGAQYARFSVEAVIRGDGQAEWGFQSPPRGTGLARQIPGVSDAIRDKASGRSDLSVFLQNLVRADLQDRIDALG